MMGHMGGMAVWMLLWGLIGLALLALIVVATVWLIRHMPASRSQSQPDPARDELRRRYAAGDIDQEEFHRRRADLGNR